MARRFLTVGLVVVAGAVAIGGCESTQDKAAKLTASSGEAFKQKGLEVTKENPDIEVVDTWALQDENGTAVAVRLRNRSKDRLVEVPIAVDVQDATGKSLYRNDASGLDPSLVGIAMLRPGEEVTWVNDQVVAAGKPVKVKAKVGAEKRVLPAEEPRITLQQIEQESDPAGAVITGFVMNKSEIDQRDIVVYASATKGDEVVALGKGQVQRVKPGQRAPFNVFFIGDPTGAKVDLAVPATVTG